MNFVTQKNRGIFVYLAFVGFIVLYAIYFNRVVELQTSWLSLLFVVLCAHALYFLFQIGRNIYIKIITFSLLFVTICYSLINILHYKVFSNFLSFSFGKGSNVYTLIESFKDYYSLVSWDSYFVAGLFLGFYIYLIFFADKASTRTSYKIALLYSVLCVLSNFAGLLLANYLHNNPRIAWSDNTVYASDIGLFGNIYSQFAEISFDYGSDEHSNLAMAQQEDIKTSAETLAGYLVELSSSEKTHLDFPRAYDKPNIFIYQLESVDKWVMKQNPNPMPFLSELMAHNISSEHFFANGCHTIDAEYSTMCSGLLHSGGPISDMLGDNTDFYCLPEMLQDKFGYNTAVFHSNEADFWNRNVLMKQWGIADYHFTPEIIYNTDDETVLNAVLDETQKQKDPFFAYIIGHISHWPYSQEAIDADNRRTGLNITAYEGEIDEEVSTYIEIEEPELRSYLGYMQEVDRNIQDFFANLEERGLADNSIVIIFGDHRLFNFLDDPSTNFYDYNDIPFVMVLPDRYQSPQKKFMSNIDIAPTLLHLLEGDSYEKPRNFVRAYGS